MLSTSKDSKEAFLESTKAAREARKAGRDREKAAVRIQAAVRGWLVRVRVAREVLANVDSIFKPGNEKASATALEMYRAAKNFVAFCWKRKKDVERLEVICRSLVASLDSENPKASYVGVALTKDHAIVWISHMKKLLSLCLEQLSLAGSKLDSVSGGASAKQLSSWLSFLVAFTSIKTWRMLHSNKAMEKLHPGMQNLCANFLGHLVQNGLYETIKVVLLNGLAGSRGIQMNKTHLTATITMAVRPLAGADYSDKLVSLFLLHILSVPGIIEHLNNLIPEVLNNLLLQTETHILAKSVKFLSQDQQLPIHFNALEGSYALCLTANLVHLVALSSSDFHEANVDFVNLLTVLTGLFSSCGQYVTAKQSNTAHWHPVLGWFSSRLDKYLQESLGTVRCQLSKLWSPSCLRVFVSPILEIVAKLPEISVPVTFYEPEEFSVEPLASSSSSTSSAGAAAKQFLMRAVDKTKSTLNSAAGGTRTSGSAGSAGKSHGLVRLGNPECMKASLVCAMFQSALQSLSQLRLEILSGLCYQSILLTPLWTLLQHLGPMCGLKTFIDHLSFNPKGTAPEFQLLTLFSDCVVYLLTLLDDVEMYEKQTPFALAHYAALSTFVNNFLYRAIWSNLILDSKSPLFISLHSLLMVLYRRDNRRPYTKPNHWLIKDCKPLALITEMDKGRKAAIFLIQKMPHIIPHNDRVVLFRRKVAAEKSTLGLTDTEATSARSTLVTIHRSRIVEDGYRQLSTLNSNALKGVIRVKFINAQGLDEAGIDQDGVFKEFLEETIKKVFDPGLNLFCATSDERLYPSPLSYLTDNHLHLFEFVGKMIGKAVYEGIVVDVPFAAFFVSQILGKDHATAFYSYMDELPSFDSELYRNLTYIKHYEGDVADLDLTFSFDQDVMGQIVTHELIPGGRGVAVTNENKISYMHLVAQFRMHTQIKDQIAAFTKGFRTIVNPDWLSIFSQPEVMRLISGDNTPLDLKDLRRHTHYYGGFHDAHRVINWLWDILEKDFDVRERAAFLKFVTSCSKPPLLGFEHLEPPFAIRCVEVGDDDDDGDTVGSVLRGFLALRRKDPVNRLPTASTCFNLLKLPNYQKKSTLREKLRYAVANNTGFELS